MHTVYYGNLLVLQVQSCNAMDMRSGLSFHLTLLLTRQKSPNELLGFSGPMPRISEPLTHSLLSPLVLFFGNAT